VGGLPGQLGGLVKEGRVGRSSRSGVVCREFSFQDDLGGLEKRGRVGKSSSKSGVVGREFPFQDNLSGLGKGVKWAEF